MYGYVVEYAREGSTPGSVVNTSTDETSVDIANLQPLSSYWFRVAVRNSSGTSGFSPKAQFPTQEGECEII